VLVQVDLVVVTGVVEAGLQVHLEAHLATHAHDTPDDALPVGPIEVLADGHEVLYLADSVLREEPGDQDVGVREVELLRRAVGVERCDPPVAALRLVEDRAEHARRVEPGAAVPVDGPFRAHEGDRVQVPDQSVLGDRQVVVHPGHLSRGQP
jgi:hypothetical protein